ncbi:MAG: hypothetical protein R3D57_19470 [Hyphomicrobiaceae bacterium]
MTWVLIGLAGVMAATVVMLFAAHAVRQKPVVVVDRAPDRPVPFGYATAWLAVRTADSIRLLEALDLTAAERASWRGGVAATYAEETSDRDVFVSPSVAGWTFVIGLALPQPAGPAYHDRAGQLLAQLADEFPDVQYYFTYPPLDLYGWARWKDGRLLRAFAIGGEGVLWNAGRATAAERLAGLRLPPEGKGGRNPVWHEGYTYPDEEQVLRLAAEWSLDPTTIDKRDASVALGYLGHAPAQWQLKRISAARRALRI